MAFGRRGAPPGTLLHGDVMAEGSRRGHAALYMAPVLMQSLLPVVTLPIFTRILTRQEYGAWGIATAIGAVVAGSATLGLHTAYERSYFAAADARARGALLSTVLVFAAALQVAGLLIVLLLAPAIAARLLGESRLAILLVLASAAAAVTSLKTYLMVTLRNEHRAREYLRYSVDELFLGVVFSFTAVVWLRLGPAGLIVGPLVAGLLVTTLLSIRILRRIPTGFDVPQLRDTLRVGLPLAPRILIGSVGNQLDKLVLGAVGSLAAVGVYAIGQRMAQFVFAFMTALQNVYQPKVYRMLFAGAPPDSIGRFLLPFGYASAALAVAAILFGREIVAAIAAPDYSLAGVVVSILAVYYGLMFFGKQPQLVFARRTGIVSLLSILTILLNGGAVYTGAIWAGAVGAAGGLLAAGVLTGTIGFVVAMHYVPIWYPLRRTVVIFASLPAALILTLLLDAAELSAAIGLAVKLAVFAAFIWGGWRSGLIPAVWGGAGEAAR
jgi:O-antigen/teichoic acid export membrane protein